MRLRRLLGRRALLGAAGAGAVVVVLVAVLAARSVPPSAVVPSALLGKAAPAASGTSVTGGRPLSLAEYRGRYVLLDFFASWCPPCQQEVPTLESFLFEHRGGGVSVLGVVVADSAAHAAAFLHRTGASWPAIADGSGHVALVYGVDSPPQLFLISPTGRVVAHVDGSPPRVELDAMLASARAVDA